MLMFVSSLVLVLSRVIGSDILSEKIPLSKIFVNPDNSNVTYIHHYIVKPTAATVEFKPGVPPRWKTKQRFKSQTKNHPLLIRSPDVEVMNISVETNNLAISLNTTLEELNVNSPNKAAFIDWLLGFFGARPQEPSNPPTEEPLKKCEACTCGLTYNHKRIVGGIETNVNEYPWMTALMYNNRFYCGASLINSKYLLTAAHCVNGFSKERLSAVFLDHDRANSFETKTFSRGINKIYRHKYYGSTGTYNNDIALLQLDKEIPFAGIMRPVCLPPTGKSFTGYRGIAVGWGATQEHGQVSSRLREVEVPIMSNIDCRKTGYGSRITDNMMCAGYPNGIKDSCQGDSGGPLHAKNGSLHLIVGIVSWGEGCAQPNYPGVYTRVNRYISWIKSNTRDACYC